MKKTRWRNPVDPKTGRAIFTPVLRATGQRPRLLSGFPARATPAMPCRRRHTIVLSQADANRYGGLEGDEAAIPKTILRRPEIPGA